MQVQMHRTSDLSELINQKRTSFPKGKPICGEKYAITHKLGQGTFGEVYIGLQINEEGGNDMQEVAIKIQSQVNSKNPQLINEAQNLKIFNENNQNLEGFPKIYASGVQGGYSYMVMELLGPNLQDLMILCGGKFSLKTTILLGIQIFQRIQSIHEKGYVYRDIKPENFIMGTRSNSSMLYIVDFGLCKKYMDQITSLHYPYRQDRTITGTVRYTSVNSHLGVEQSRRDDLEAICYMLIYFMKGKLPWQGIKGDGKIQKQHVIMQRKLKITTQELCEDLPYEFNSLISYCRDLSYYDDPDYSFIFGELNSLYIRSGFVLNYNYDWVVLKCYRQYETMHVNIQLGRRDQGQDPYESSSQSQKQIEVEPQLYQQKQSQDLLDEEQLSQQNIEQ